MNQFRAAAPVLLSILGWIFGGMAFFAMAWAVNDGNLNATITLGTFTISGLICIMGGMITHCGIFSFGSCRA